MLTPLRVAVLCSHRAPGLMHLLNADPDRGRAFEIVCCLTSEPTFAEMVEESKEWLPTDLRRACLFAHEQWMMRSCSGPMWSAAPTLVASGALDLDRLASSSGGAARILDLGRRGGLMSAAQPLAVAR